MQRALPADVFNIEVDCHHVYEVGDAGVLVHNACAPLRAELIGKWGDKFMKGMQAAHIIPKNGWSWADKDLKKIIDRVTKMGLIDDVANGFASTAGHAGTHTMVYVNDLIKVMKSRTTVNEIKEGMDILWSRIKAGKYVDYPLDVAG